MSPGRLEEQPNNPHRAVSCWRLTTVLVGIFCLPMAAGAQQISPLTSDDAPAPEKQIPRYSVEIIVFSYADNVSSGSEIFLPDAVDEPMEAAATLAEVQEQRQSIFMPGEETVADSVPEYGDFLVEFEDEELVELIANERIDLKILLPDELTMTEIHEELLLLDAYQPVMWAGWTQATLAEEETPLIRLRRLGNLPLKFDGNLKLYLSRFLHLVIDISMDGESTATQEPILPAATSGFERGYIDAFGYLIYADVLAPALHYRIIENRIMKNGDIRYFDHPKFGVLAKVTRYEAAAEDEEMEFEAAPVVLDTAN